MCAHTAQWIHARGSEKFSLKFHASFLSFYSLFSLCAFFSAVYFSVFPDAGHSDMGLLILSQLPLSW